MEPYDERELPDGYPVYGRYLYIADDKLYCSEWHDITVAELKRREGFKSVKNCDIARRGLWDKMT